MTHNKLQPEGSLRIPSPLTEVEQGFNEVQVSDPRTPVEPLQGPVGTAVLHISHSSQDRYQDPHLVKGAIEMMK